MLSNINIDLIKELRKRTSISIIKCKQALIDSKGDIELAIDNLRKSGLNTNIHKSNKFTSSGVILIELTADRKKGLIIEINCETDFVSKNDFFNKFVKTVIITALKSSIDNIDTLRRMVEEQRLILVNQCNENIYINKFKILTGSYLSSYLHGTKIGVIVAASGNIDKDILKNISMHIAARNPKYIDVDSIPEDILNKERYIQMEILLKNKLSKPKNILEKIVEGRMKQFISDITLTEQEFILDTHTKVGNVLQKSCMKIDNFIRFELGEY